jgi:hypothetical protein
MKDYSLLPDSSMLQIREYSGTGYQPLVDSGAWRVAILRFIDELLPDRMDNFHRHDQTEEVFVLLTGRCILFLAGSGERLEEIRAADMEREKFYVVAKGCWHSHTLSEGAAVLIVENRDTNEANTPHLALQNEQRRRIAELTRHIWKSGE